MSLDHDTEIQLRDRFQSLPSAVRDAITSAHLSEHLESLAKTHKLHFDQWQILENEVVMTLLGLQNQEELEENIVKEVGVEHDIAHTLTMSIAQEVFAPIRAELEKILDTSGKASESNPAVNEHSQSAIVSEVVEGATKIEGAGKVLAPSSGAYKTGEASTERKDVHDDPYRESVV